MEKLLIFFLWMTLTIHSENTLDTYIQGELNNCRCDANVIIVKPADAFEFDFDEIPSVFATKKTIFFLETAELESQKNSYLIQNEKLIKYLKELMKTNGPYLIEFSNGRSKMILDLSKLSNS
jgi:hypothetical protein